MRIMQFMPEFGLAGAETMCENLAYELIKQGHMVCVVSLYDYHSPITERLEQQGITTLYLNKKPGADLGVIKRIRNVIKEFHPDILHTHRYILKYVMAASVGLQIKGIVHTVHNIAQKENNGADRFVNRLFFKKKNIVPVALSNEIRKTINIVYKLPNAAIPIVFNGTPIDGLNKKSNYDFGEKVRIINIGRYTSVKNQLALIEAIHQLHKEDPRIELDIYGDGPLKDQLNQKIKDLKAEKYIRENGLTDNVSEKLQKSDIFVLPSIYEGMPMTIIEAMSAGLPVIASNVGGIPDMITDSENGLLCGTDVESISSALRKMIQNETLRQHIGNNALERAKDFSAEKMATSYLKLYSSFI